MIKVQIDRKTWLRSVVDDQVRLRNEDGNQCCLGFVCKKLGLANNDIENIPDPGSFGDSEFMIDFGVEGASLKNLVNKLTPHLLTVRGHNEKHWVGEAMRLNDYDDDDMSEEEREEKLTALFLKNGFELKFVGPKVNPFTEK